MTDRLSTTVTTSHALSVDGPALFAIGVIG